MASNQQDFICPITLLPMKDPVIAEDGHTYEREAIVHWLQTNPNSPLTRQPMRIDALNPNTKLKQAIERYNKKDEKKEKKEKKRVSNAIPSVEADHYYALSIYQQDILQQPLLQQHVVIVQRTETTNPTQPNRLNPEQRKKQQIVCFFIVAFVIFVIILSKVM